MFLIWKGAGISIKRLKPQISTNCATDNLVSGDFRFHFAISSSIPVPILYQVSSSNTNIDSSFREVV